MAEIRRIELIARSTAFKRNAERKKHSNSLAFRLTVLLSGTAFPSDHQCVTGYRRPIIRVVTASDIRSRHNRNTNEKMSDDPTVIPVDPQTATYPSLAATSSSLAAQELPPEALS